MQPYGQARPALVNRNLTNVTHVHNQSNAAIGRRVDGEEDVTSGLLGQARALADEALRGLPPSLVVIIDTEEEFDWSRPLSPSNISVTSISGQTRAHDIFDRHGIVPTYVVDYPVATNPTSAGILQDLVHDGRCVIGAHLHPWVNPPQIEDVTPRNSYPGNLPAELEYDKLARLTSLIAASFGAPPTVYRAGRFGIGSQTPALLERLGYRIDTSVVPRTSFVADGGPDFSGFDFRPVLFGTRPILELPQACGFCGALEMHGPYLYPRLFDNPWRRLRAPGIFARLRLLERIRLTPEGITLAEQKRLVHSLLRQGCKVFLYTYHSPSLVPGHTPYVRTAEDLARFLECMDRFFAFFIEELGGHPATPEALYDRLVPQAA